MGGCGAIMLLGDTQLIDLPEAPDFMLSGLKHPQVDVFDRRALFNGIEDQATGNTSFTAHKSFEVDLGQRTQGRVLTEKAYAAVGISGRLPTAASRYSATV